MNDNSKIEIDIKNHDFNNNELSGDIKPSVQSVVIPTQQDIEKKPESPVVAPEYDVTISNTEVFLWFDFHLVCNYHSKERNRYGLFGYPLFHYKSIVVEHISNVDGYFTCNDCVSVSYRSQRY